jgi:hypothetical protein
MTSRDFAFWLQGFFEISKENPNYSGELNSAQVKMIEKHLSLVFVHEIDNSYGDKKHTDKLNGIHNSPLSYMSKDEDIEISLRPRC